MSSNIESPTGFRLSLLLEPLMQLGMGLGAYLVTAAAIYLFYLIGSIPGIHLPWFGLVGLVLVTIAALAGTAWLTWRGDVRAGSLGPIAVLLLVVAIFSIADVAMSDGKYFFWKIKTIHTLTVQASMIGVAALGMTILIVAGGIDLSAGANISLSATVLAWVLIRMHGWLEVDSSDPSTKEWLVILIGVVAVLACLAAGAAAGLLNGVLVTQLQVVPFIVTLGTMSIFMGLNKFLTDSTSIRPDAEIPGIVPGWVTEIARITSDENWLLPPLVPMLGWGVWLMLGLALAVGALLEYTVVGRHFFALGSSEPTARLCGINTIFTKTLAYTVSGLFCGIAALYFFGSTGRGSPADGPGMELKVIAAVVIGGGSLNGGRGSVIGTLCGGALMQTIELGCGALELKNHIQDMIIGAIIVGAVALDQVREGKITVLQSVDRARELLHPLGVFSLPLRLPLDGLADWLRRDAGGEEKSQS